MLITSLMTIVEFWAWVNWNCWDLLVGYGLSRSCNLVGWKLSYIILSHDRSKTCSFNFLKFFSRLNVHFVWLPFGKPIPYIPKVKPNIIVLFDIIVKKYIFIYFTHSNIIINFNTVFRQFPKNIQLLHIFLSYVQSYFKF